MKKPKYLQLGSRTYLRMPKGTITPPQDTLMVIPRGPRPKLHRLQASPYPDINAISPDPEGILDIAEVLNVLCTTWDMGDSLSMSIHAALKQAHIARRIIDVATYPDDVRDSPFVKDAFVYGYEVVFELLDKVCQGESDVARGKWDLYRAGISEIRWQLIPGRPKLARAIDAYVESVNKIMTGIVTDDPTWHIERIDSNIATGRIASPIADQAQKEFSDMTSYANKMVQSVLARIDVPEIQEYLNDLRDPMTKVFMSIWDLSVIEAEQKPLGSIVEVFATEVSHMIVYLIVRPEQSYVMLKAHLIGCRLLSIMESPHAQGASCTMAISSYVAAIEELQAALYKFAATFKAAKSKSDSNPREDLKGLPTYVKPWPRDNDALKKYYPKLLSYDTTAEEIFRPANSALQSAATISGFAEECYSNGVHSLLKVFASPDVTLDDHIDPVTPITAVADVIDTVLRDYEPGRIRIPWEIRHMILCVKKWLKELPPAVTDEDIVSCAHNIEWGLSEFIYARYITGEEVTSRNRRDILDCVSAVIDNYPELLTSDKVHTSMSNSAMQVLLDSFHIAREVQNSKGLLNSACEAFKSCASEMAISDSEYADTVPVVVTCDIIDTALHYYIDLYAKYNPVDITNKLYEKIFAITKDISQCEHADTDKIVGELNLWEKDMHRFMKEVSQCSSLDKDTESTDNSDKGNDTEVNNELHQKIVNASEKTSRKIKEILDYCIAIDNIIFEKSLVSSAESKKYLPEKSVALVTMMAISKILRCADSDTVYGIVNTFITDVNAASSIGNLNRKGSLNRKDKDAEAMHAVRLIAQLKQGVKDFAKEYCECIQ